MKSYIDLLNEVLHAPSRVTRNATTRSLFGATLEFDLRQGFPILTTKKMPFKSIAAEMIGFLRGYTNANRFEADGCKVWRANADDPKWRHQNAACGIEDGDLGRTYGAQWRTWKTHKPILVERDDFYEVRGYERLDQISNLMHLIRTGSSSRRMVVSAWNPAELDDTALPPCHLMFQIYCHEGFMDLQMYQRSADIFLGLPFNISSYALLLWILANTTGYTPRNLRMCLGDVHLYEQHIPHTRMQLGRIPDVMPWLKGTSVMPPRLEGLQPWEFDASWFRLVGYDPHPPIKAEMIV